MTDDKGKRLERFTAGLQNPFVASENRLQEILRANAEAREAPTARGIFKRLVEQIRRFEVTVDPDHEVGAKLASFGQAITIHVSDLGYIQPSIITFRGALDSGEPIELIQHVNQLNILLVKVRRLTPDQPKRPIGFAAWDK